MGGSVYIVVARAQARADASVGDAQAATEPSEPEATQPSTTPTTSPPDLAAYSASRYAARVPSDWTAEKSDAQRSGFLESKWRDPSDPNTSLTIDASPNESLTPSAKAASVRSDVEGASGYQEIDFGSTTLGNHDAWRWVFQVSGDQRVDYFLNECDTGVAVLGSTSPDLFSELEPTFEHVANSVQINCAGSTGAGHVATTQSSGDFCSTHSCIPNFYNRTGYIVQCNDGMWSHSGGRPGACSYHGGENAETSP